MRSKKTLPIAGFFVVALLFGGAWAQDAPSAEKGTTEKARQKADSSEPRRQRAKPSNTKAAPAPALEARKVRVEYQGLLQDENDQPISGVFALDFKIYDRSLAATPLWSERHFVAVVGGEYVAPLGTYRPLISTHIEGERWIGIELVGEGEILRDNLMVHEPTTPLPAQVAGRGSPGARVTFSDVADRAIEADRARVAESAEKLGDMSLEEIERLSNLALERLGEHISDPDAHSAMGRSGRSGVGTERRVMELIGGRGGAAYDVRCPPGFVVTGVEGTAGRVVDNFRLVCSPLQ
ncbi:MAG: hypothetical protein ACNA8W_20435 [Bradymonadaceae bacterium]